MNRLRFCLPILLVSLAMNATGTGLRFDLESGDLQVDYNGEKILFSYRPGGTHRFHLYEIQAEGSGLRQLTDGDYDDIEPSYLPDGRIVFCSTRCNCIINCNLVETAALYSCDADGGGIRPVSSNNETENTPWPMPDGRVLFTRLDQLLLLLAPLSKEHGGYGICGEKKTGQAVFTDKTGAGYRELLEMIEACKTLLDANPRFDNPDFRPNPHYVREMKRMGILPEKIIPSDVDVYATDEAYWRSLWWKPQPISPQ